jgi:hypothetical protein
MPSNIPCKRLLQDKSLPDNSPQSEILVSYTICIQIKILYEKIVAKQENLYSIDFGPKYPVSKCMYCIGVFDADMQFRL